ncbi:MAG: aminotransferase class IV [Bacteroidales bacterium]
MKHKFIETIRFANSEAQLIDYHQRRIELTQETFYGLKNLNLRDILPNVNEESDMRCRIVYSDKVEDVEVTKPIEYDIQELVVVHANGINYDFKSANRRVFDKLSEGLEPNQSPLVVKDGFITDTPISNVVIKIGDELITPKAPLLKGVQRQFLIDNHIITEAPVPISIMEFVDEIMLVNCMMPLEKSIRLPKTAIKNWKV